MHAEAVALPTTTAPMPAPVPRAAPAALTATLVKFTPDAATAPDQAAAIATPSPTSAEILSLPSDTARRYMLPARLGSVRALNQPKDRVRKAGRPACTTKPLPKRPAATATASLLKPRRHCTSPRVLHPVSASATIIQLPQRRLPAPAQSAALERTA